jgi:hypothetical protein
MKISGCTNNLKRAFFNAHNKDNILHKFMLTSVKMHMQIYEEHCLSKAGDTLSSRHVSSCDVTRAVAM